MRKIDIKSNEHNWNYLDSVYNELIGDIERTQYENRNLAERINFYKTLLHNIPALFFIIDLSVQEITWKNREFDSVINNSPADYKKIIKQIIPYYKTQKRLQENKNMLSNNGIFKIVNYQKEPVSFYFKGFVLKYDKNRYPLEIFINAFNLSEKINTDLQLEELIKENKRLKNKLALSILTKREKEIVKMVAEGMSSKKISEELGLSFYTVETHRKNILNKIDINNTAELIRFATEAGLV